MEEHKVEKPSETDNRKGIPSFFVIRITERDRTGKLRIVRRLPELRYW